MDASANVGEYQADRLTTGSPGHLQAPPLNICPLRLSNCGGYPGFDLRQATPIRRARSLLR
jgi:hypothetical protein